MKHSFSGPKMLLVLAGFLCLTDHVKAESPRPASTGSTVTIGFDKVVAGAFTVARNSGFEVSAKQAWGWVGEPSFGDPAGSIEFSTPANVKTTKSVIVTHDGKPFTFQSVAIYSSTTQIPYRFRGSLNGLTKYNTIGTVPNTFGAFATTTNSNASIPIDRLVISITNPSVPVSNPEGLDNIVVQPAVTADIKSAK